VHVRNANALIFGVDSADILLYELGLASCCFDATRAGNQGGHLVFSGQWYQARNHLIEPEYDRYTVIFAEIVMTARDDFDPLAPQREAAFFYGLFLRGHSVETLRQDIDVPPAMLDKWLKARDFEEPFREALQRVYVYRKQVLAIFDGLIWNEQRRPQLQ
jgi:hypothetical protein